MRRRLRKALRMSVSNYGLRKQSGGRSAYHDQSCLHGREEELKSSWSWYNSLDGVVLRFESLTALTTSREFWWGERMV
jgi:hypothetical protein